MLCNILDGVDEEGEWEKCDRVGWKVGMAVHEPGREIRGGLVYLIYELDPARDLGSGRRIEDYVIPSIQVMHYFAEQHTSFVSIGDLRKDQIADYDQPSPSHL